MSWTLCSLFYYVGVGISGGCQRKGAETAFQQKMFASFLRGAGYMHETLKLADNKLEGGVVVATFNSFAIKTHSVIVCPDCGYQHAEQMPHDSCIWFYECQHCHALLKPKPGDCCVFCSYGTVPCPPEQQRRHNACS